MKTKEQIEKEINLTLDSVGAFNRYDGKPFLLTRIQSRINDKQPASQRGRFIGLRNLIYQPYIIGIVLIFNIFSAVYIFSNNDSLDINRDQYIDQLADEFAYSSNDYYLNTLIENN